MEEIVCPKCHSNQLTANSKGFNNTNAALGMLTGNAVQGLALGMLGSNKIIVTCLKCGNKFQAGDGSVRTVDSTGAEKIEKQVFVDKDKVVGRRIALVLTIVLIIIVIAIVSFFNSLKSDRVVSNNDTSTSNATIIAIKGANIRQSPSISSSIVVKLNNSDRILIVDKSSNPDVVNGSNGYWYKIKTIDGQEGFIWSATVQPDE